MLLLVWVLVLTIDSASVVLCYMLCAFLRGCLRGFVVRGVFVVGQVFLCRV